MANCDWGGSCINSDPFTPFFDFRAVHKIDGHSLCPTGDRENPLTTRHSSRPVRAVTVSEVYRCCGMLHWLAACTALEHVSFEIVVHRDDFGLSFPNVDRFSAPKFRQALLPFSGTLKTLRVAADESFYIDLEWQYEDIEEEPFGSFKEFVVLQDFVVRHSHLIRLFPSRSSGEDRKPFVDILPPSLKSLSVKDIVDEGYPDLLFGAFNVVATQAFLSST
ncbi:hypothetical protein ABOM_012211 [Aspergillus bombycis]|uniref:F-box domain protein n=1 Tax=Aspergillus bombycis TaxID=109264 RepID=A0A1F7ZI58_9EURO|nr:hypothetical protein ABOM_012211 [Aspergillus bombycis]OGM39143.1 hypothetical protein ABOM_012211 [Aspergillus bombycis]